MALLLRDREAPPEAAIPSSNGGHPAGVPDFACKACGAGMTHGQDWCLECGTAARGRLGSRPGWGAAFTVVGVTLLLICGAVLASYAALTSDAERTASAPTAGDGKPIVTQAPGVAPPGDNVPVQPGATGPGTTPPTVVPGAGQAPPARSVIPTPRPVVPPKAGVVPPSAGTPAKPQSGTTQPSAGTGKTPSQQSAPANVAPQVINLKSGSASTYDPAKRAGAEFGPAANAVDGKLGSMWDVTVPADGKAVGAGVLVDLNAPYALHSLKVATETPGFRLELYGAVDKATPVDILDKRWQHLTDAKQVSNGQTVALKGKGEAAKYRLFLAYITTPGQPTDPRVAINELLLTGTP